MLELDSGHRANLPDKANKLKIILILVISLSLLFIVFKEVRSVVLTRRVDKSNRAFVEIEERLIARDFVAARRIHSDLQSRWSERGFSWKMIPEKLYDPIRDLREQIIAAERDIDFCMRCEALTAFYSFWKPAIDIAQNSRREMRDSDVRLGLDSALNPGFVLFWETDEGESNEESNEGGSSYSSYEMEGDERIARYRFDKDLPWNSMWLNVVFNLALPISNQPLSILRTKIVLVNRLYVHDGNYQTGAIGLRRSFVADREKAEVFVFDPVSRGHASYRVFAELKETTSDLTFPLNIETILETLGIPRVELPSYEMGFETFQKVGMYFLRYFGIRFWNA